MPTAQDPSAPAESSQLDPTATVFLQDVYRGLPGVPPGTVKYLRVMEQIPKPWAAEVDLLRDEDRGADGFGGHLAVSWNAHIWIAVLRGIVPVEEDGSAYFEVPARRNLFFQALDENFMEVQRMRTFVNFEPGEQRSCIGCHEHRTQAPASRLPIAFGRSPAKLSAQPGEVAPRPLYYPTDVQPILDRHCIQCHDGSAVGHASSVPSSDQPHIPLPIPQTLTKAAPDLRGDLTTLFNRSYESILQGGLVATIREWAGGDYAMQNAEAVPPYSLGSHRSRLVEVLKAGHYEVKLVAGGVDQAGDLDRLRRTVLRIVLRPAEPFVSRSPRFPPGADTHFRVRHRARFPRTAETRSPARAASRLVAVGRRDA